MSTVHPDDELLSAALDGGEEETAAHARGCPDCQLRLARLRAAAEAVASPVPAVSTAVRAAAVRRAMQEGGADLSGRRATRRRAQRRRAHRRLPGWAPVAALAAAAAVAAVVAVPIVLSGSGPWQRGHTSSGSCRRANACANSWRPRRRREPSPMRRRPCPARLPKGHKARP